MGKKGFAYFLASLIIISFFYPTALKAAKKVIVQGSSFFEPGREMIAREKALDEAKRAAIEKAVGVAIESKTLVEDLQIIRDQILTRSSGYLKNITILEEKKTELGTYDVTIEAEVEFSALISDFDRFQQIAGWQKNPRVSIMMEPGVEKKLPSEGKIVNLLAERLRESGLRVFRYNEKDESSMGLIVGLFVEFFSFKTDYQDLMLKSNEVSLSANIYRQGSNEIIASSSAVKALPGENQLKVYDKCINLCIDEIWKDLRKKLTKQWEKELYNERSITLIAKNVLSYSQAEKIKGIFEAEVKGVVTVDLLKYRDSQSEYEIIYRGWPRQLYHELQMSYFKKKHFDSDIKEITADRLIVTIK